MYEFTVTCALLKRYAKGSGWGLKKKVLALRAPVWSKKGVGGGGGGVALYLDPPLLTSI